MPVSYHVQVMLKPNQLCLTSLHWTPHLDHFIIHQLGVFNQVVKEHHVSVSKWKRQPCYEGHCSMYASSCATSYSNSLNHCPFWHSLLQKQEQAQLAPLAWSSQAALGAPSWASRDKRENQAIILIANWRNKRQRKTWTSTTWPRGGGPGIGGIRGGGGIMPGGIGGIGGGRGPIGGNPMGGNGGGIPGGGI